MKWTLFFLIVFLLAQIHPTQAQETETLAIPPVNSVMVWNEQGEIELLDANTGERTPYFNVNLDFDYRLAGLHLAAGIQRLFLWEHQGYIAQARILEFNYSTQEQTIILDKPNIFGFELSPDGRQIIIYFEPDDETRASPAGPRYACLLDILRHTCAEFPFVSARYIWIEPERLITFSNELYPREQEICVIHISDITVCERELQAPEGTGALQRIPNTSRVLFYNRSTQDFFIGDISSGQNSDEFGINSQRDLGILYHTLRFSPDSAYMMFFTEEYDYVIVDFESSTLVAELPNLMNAQWLPNNLSIVAVTYPTLGEYPAEFIRYNLATGEMRTLMTFTEELIFTVVY